MKVKNKLAVVTILMMIALVIIAAVSNFNFGNEAPVIGECEVTHYSVNENKTTHTYCGYPKQEKEVEVND